MCESYRSLTEEKRVTCKDRMCEWCSETIYKGETCQYRAYVFGGEFTSGYLHTECFDALCDSDNKAVCDGWMPGDWERGVSAKYGDWS